MSSNVTYRIRTHFRTRNEKVVNGWKPLTSSVRLIRRYVSTPHALNLNRVISLCNALTLSDLEKSATFEGVMGGRGGGGGGAAAARNSNYYLRSIPTDHFFSRLLVVQGLVLRL